MLLVEQLCPGYNEFSTLSVSTARAEMPCLARPYVSTLSTMPDPEQQSEKETGKHKHRNERANMSLLSRTHLVLMFCLSYFFFLYNYFINQFKFL